MLPRAAEQRDELAPPHARPLPATIALHILSRRLLCITAISIPLDCPQLGQPLPSQDFCGTAALPR